MYRITGLIGVLGGLALCGAAPTQNITSEVYFYGDSPPVYPSPEGTGTGAWATAYEKAKALVAQLTDEEKVNLTAGTTTTTGCSGVIAAIPRVNFPGLCVSDAGNGLRGTDYVNSWASGIHVGASWNKTLAHERALYMGQEFHRKGVNLLLGPVVGPLGRVAEGGRNWEGFSNDPYLTGALVYETVQGVQESGVGVSTKHYIGNEQETNRNPETVDGVGIASVSSNIDDKAIHELYLWPFQDAVRAGSVAIMCSYERINNSYACQNSKTLNGLLKTELGFQGYVITDWGAQHGGIASANAGLDMVMPDSTLWGANLTTAIANGSMEASRLDDMVTRILATWYQLNQDMDFPTPGVGMPASVDSAHQAVMGTSPDEKGPLLQSAIEGHVLVKNTNSALPLQSPHLVSVFGYDAKGPEALSFTASLSAGPPIQNYTLYVGGGSGSNSPAYLITPLDAIQQQAYQDSTAVVWDVSSEDPEVDPTSEACLVFINSFATEGYDRPGLVDESSDTLVTNVAGKCNNTIVVIHNAGVRLVYDWIDHANVTAVILAHLPGQDTGTALVDLLYHRANPSGRLPYTVAKQASDYGSLLHPSEPQTPYGLFPQSDYTEGVYIDYRAFDKQNITPQFEFGFGLSYTTFDYSALDVQTTANATTSQYPPSATIEEGGNPHLWDEIVTVTASVQNSGSADGDEVAQLYVGIPNGPVRQLRGFEKVHIPVGQTVQVSFALGRRDLSTWSAEAQQWLLQSGTYQVYVGRSSRDLPLTGQFSI
ncbi:putative beta-glucosidase M [Aspergillus ellipticus CBS 707.79]|uniref:Probable beta-glucosidase M n=1 Tax=Aspergillus ellipticus CBS 707.79 TaxID=1448320 RepID=A0A319EXY7_9EURO|nr:putative beta-glucosidase M [Aspergillus ellipticus CBS 707.79]